MDTKLLLQKENEIQIIHNKVMEIFKTAGVQGDLLKEYQNKVSQYNNMYESLEAMRKSSDSQDTIDGLFAQQLSVLDTWMHFEIEIAQRAANSN